MDSGFIREGFLGEALSFAQFSNPLANHQVGANGTTTREGVFGCRLKGNIYSGASGWPGLVVHELFRTLF
jgi:hypothetical protein